MVQEEPTSFCLKNRDHIDRFNEIPVLGILVRRQRTFVRSAAQFGDVLFKRRVGAQAGDLPSNRRGEGLDNRVQ